MSNHENEKNTRNKKNTNKASDALNARKANDANKPRRPKRGLIVGIALIAVFLIAPLMFVFIHIYSESTRTAVANYAGKPGLDHEIQLFGQTLSYTEQVAIRLNKNEPSEEHSEELDQFHSEPIEQERGPTGVAYLTFDDGPSRTITPGLLDILAEEEIRATFFIIPHERVDDIYRRIIDEGHEIGNHTYSHVYSVLYEGTVSAFREDVLRARNFIYDNFGYTTTSFRFPGGSFNWSRAIQNPRLDVIRELGYRHFDWHVDTEDWRRDATVESVVRNVLDFTNGREDVIVLMHDNYQVTLDALPLIIEGLREQGYTFDIVRNFPLP